MTAPDEDALADLVRRFSREVGRRIPLEVDTQSNGIPVVQPYGTTRGYADAVLTVDRKTKDVVAADVQTDAT